MAETTPDLRESVEIELKFPIEFDGEKITSLTMRRAKVRDKLKAKNVKGDEMDKVLALIANLVERPVDVLAELDDLDLEQLQTQYLAFTGRTPEMDAS